MSEFPTSGCGCHIRGQESNRTALNPAPTPRTPCDEGQHTYEHNFRQDRVISACRVCAHVSIFEIPPVPQVTLREALESGGVDQDISGIIDQLTDPSPILSHIVYKESDRYLNIGCPSCGMTGDRGVFRIRAAGTDGTEVIIVSCLDCNHAGTLEEFTTVEKS